MTSSSSPRTRPGRLRIALGLLIFLCTWYLYRESPVFQFGDARYTLLTSTALLDGNGFDVEPYLPNIHERRRLPYNLTTGRDHLLLWYPPGTAVLSAPLFLAMKPFGYRAVDAEGRHDRAREERAMRHLGPFVVALFILLAYFIAAELLPTAWAAGVTALMAVGSPAWSTMSRSLWSHNWMVVLVAAAVWFLLRAERRDSPPNPLVLATLLAWAFYCRPTGAIALAAVGIYLLFRWKRAVLGYVMTATAWSAAFVYWSWSAYGSLIPSYYAQGTRDHVCGESMGSALAGVLVSPSRGLLLFCPWILLAVWLLWRYRSHVPYVGLVHLAWPICVAQVWVVAKSTRWWGGYCYGPRLMSDALPWLLLLVVLAADAWRRGRRRRGRYRGRRAEVAVVAFVLLLTVALHSPGALSIRAHRWNQDTRCGLGLRVWDWSNPQFLAWRVPREPGTDAGVR